MLRVSLVPEPPLLADVGTRNVSQLAGDSPIAVKAPSRIKGASNIYLPCLEKDPGALSEEYRRARDALWTLSGGRCTFCEAMCQRSFNTVEHLRPKRHYPWLTWTWSNLAFCCPGCNSNKGDYFPLQTPTVLAFGSESYHQESPWLPDPHEEDAERHVQFVLMAKNRWQPIARNRSRHGSELIAAYKLDRPELLDLYTLAARHFEGHLGALLDCADRSGFLTCWTRFGPAPGAPFVSLLRDLCRDTFSEETLRRWDLGWVDLGLEVGQVPNR